VYTYTAARDPNEDRRPPIHTQFKGHNSHWRNPIIPFQPNILNNKPERHLGNGFAGNTAEEHPPPLSKKGKKSNIPPTNKKTGVTDI